jgi:hypothetical protein
VVESAAVGVEKDPGFFAALRKTQKSCTRGIAKDAGNLDQVMQRFPHRARRQKRKERRLDRRRPFFLSGRAVRLFGLLLRPHLLNLLALILDFLLLLLHLCLGLCVGVLLILHRVADYVAGSTAKHTAY